MATPTTLSIVWTAVPRSYDAAKRTIRLSVSVSFRLPPSSHTATARLVNDLLSDWPKTLKGYADRHAFSVTLRKDTTPGQTVPATVLPAPTSDDALSSNLWAAVIHPPPDPHESASRYPATTFVRDKPPRLNGVPIRSHPAIALSKSVDSYHSDCFEVHAKLHPNRRQNPQVRAPMKDGWVAKLDAHDALPPLQWASAPQVPGSREPFASLAEFRRAGTSAVGDSNSDRLLERDLYRLSDRPKETLSEEVIKALGDLHHEANLRLANARRFDPPDKPPAPHDVRKDFLRLKLSSSRVPAPFAPEFSPANVPPMDLEDLLTHVRNHLSLWRPLGLVFDLEAALPAGAALSDFNQVRASADLGTSAITQPSLWTMYTTDAGAFRAADDPGVPWLKNGMLDVRYAYSIVPPPGGGPPVHAVDPKFAVTSHDVEGAGLQLLNYAAQTQAIGGQTLITTLDTIVSADAAAQKLIGPVPSKAGRPLQEVLDLTEAQRRLLADPLLESLRNESVKRAGSDQALRVDITALGTGQDRILVWQLTSGAQNFALRDTAPPRRASAGLGLVWDDRAMNAAARKARATTLQSGESSGADMVLLSSDLLFGYLPDVFSVGKNRWQSLTARAETYRRTSDQVVVHCRKRAEAPIRTQASRATDRTEAQAANHPELGPVDDSLTEYLFHWTGWSLSLPDPKQKWDSYAGPATGDPPPNDRPDTFSAEYTPLEEVEPALRIDESYRLRVRLVDVAGGYFDGGSLPEESAAMVTEPFYYGRYEPVGAPLVLIRDSRPHSRPSAGLTRLIIDRSGDRDERVLAPARVSLDLAETHGLFDQQVPSVARSFRDARLRADGTFPLMTPNGAVVIDLPLDPTTQQAPEGWPCFLAPDGTAPTTPFFPDPLAEQIGFTVETLDGLRWSTRSDEDNPLDKLAFYRDGAKWPHARVVSLRLVPGDPAFVTVNEARDTLEIGLPPGWTATARFHASPSQDGAKLLVEGVAHPGEQRTTNVTDEDHPMLYVPQVVELVHPVKQPLSAPIVNLVKPVESELGKTSHTLTFSVRADLTSTSHVQLEAEWPDPDDDPLSPIPHKNDAPSRHGQAKLGSWQLPSPRSDDPATVEKELTYDFHDGRHRNLSVKATGFSRFRGYYTDQDERAFALAGQAILLSIQATVPPKPPEIAYIVPTFEWAKTTAHSAVTSHRQGGLRVYMPRGWYSSGAGEKLGVVLWPHQTRTHVLRATGIVEPKLPDRLADKVTLWGLDPTRDAFLRSELPALGDFAYHDDLEPSLELPSSPGDLVTVVAYAPRFDPDRVLWFADIPIRPAPADGAFVRLALVRYQREAVSGAKISDVVLADFAQLVPDRQVTVTRLDPRTLTVLVEGTPLGQPGQMGSWGSMTKLDVSVWRPGPDTDARAADALGWVKDPDLVMTSEPIEGGLYPRTRVAINGSGPRRLVVVEYQLFRDDSPNLDGDRAQRMLYSDILRLP